ncbi:magnesium transporter [Clostridium fungisolvens]|uniref:Magnesium transporter MgtE n=1 Tax=Clostridium fungisolvens TaxID=1604897 RepID=A0A6V8SNF9_9CLOT|nr:magnesium transporter [Clostridium fungisolvens]GFP78246.1 Magnesium transporter MgtE [Clostridium fungisolvens]
MKTFGKEDIKEMILTQSLESLEKLLEEVHPVDILDVLRELEDEKYSILKKLPNWLVADIFEEMDEDEQQEALNLFSELDQFKILNEMSSDEITDLLGNLEPDKVDRFLGNIDKEDAEEVKELLTYEEDTAGGIMATEFIAIKENMTVKETLSYLQTTGIEAETVYYLYVLDSSGILTGILSLRDLVISSFDTKISSIMTTSVKSVPVHMDQEEVANIFQKYGFQAMPVIDDLGEMLGVVTFDDIIDIVRQEDNEDIYRLGGLSEGEAVDGSVMDSVRSRLPWLLVNLITAIIAGATVGLFSSTIDKLVILATFNPIIAGMGGNAGTQSLTLIVRGIALGELNKENAKRVFLKEIIAGLFNGIAIGIVVAILGLIWANKPVFGLVVGVAMILNMSLATVVGYLVPVILKKLNIDPALASAVFVTTFTDVCGFFFFLGLATMFLKYLM